ncbi:30S ribosomal protein S13 [Candidatus Uhrbacteria bacterium RIFCSPLOWO2_12_FULL_46_10]|uniref:Small ribosomal subunit protein uS13 n=1 Tax=Candidatus Uhrbacteria bacterium RIFCSPLOWO2_01_FULL_47_25 TaxID=1802402 RepID=A0A1F7UZH4_9BACT|nr:MAG: 30S ribosomal protein S13 [Candidatus Uhrbacteria bacterium RIFCSPHIGHO2_01_FULL_46_23]OGL70650.1 MAG: 30S ribosomal protein S13 [Candidatus Uhrbacteria bacterium RIFCSPHIGHO2_02_FULL_47_29]OGL76416.1 MAG: 30S ribosomal protein S13 [Candidatus Uhrbacteria bacterium RIFCSPHIGHO2_12_FULL_46_13]OGL83157.1 MAG: 30S ribosomal protein S13 [Candidatus Uhrbacteria bacterium RIFCSPLOWO2_01_FULL_47_25]OGL84065.1 MAG: 30S ribosomal protein S13 [Candidatus Uhrbacteria bacterium RIFCSPLOWO2_02_FULL_
MARIAGVTLPNDKRIEIALTYIYGIGLPSSRAILKATDIDGNIRVKDLKDNQLNAVREQIEKRAIKVEGDLSRDILMHIRRLKDIGCYRGIRHIKHLPLRGQRTKTNTRTVRGNVRRTMGSGRKDAHQKT